MINLELKRIVVEKCFNYKHLNEMYCISIRYVIVKHVSGKIKEPCENHNLGKLLFELLRNVFIMLHINERNATVVSHTK